MIDVITIGVATRDVFLRSSQLKILRDPEHLTRLGFPTGEAECVALGSKLDVEEPIFAVGGGAANAAVTFARQGHSVGTIVRVGNDVHGKEILQTLRSEKIAVTAITDKTTATAYSTILLTPSGERTILVYRGAASGFQKRDFQSRFFKATWAYITPGDMSPPLLKEIITSLKRNGVRIAMNPSGFYVAHGGSRVKPFLKNLDVVLVNREEASQLTGIPYNNEKRIFKKFDDLISGIAVVTDGPRGAAASDGSFIYRAGIFKEKKLVDRTGAGDAFGSGFIAGLLRGNDIHSALRLAAANATSVVEHVGAQTGILRKKEFTSRRWSYLDMDVEPL